LKLGSYNPKSFALIIVVGLLYYQYGHYQAHC